jgi:hypothetical protein
MIGVQTQRIAPGEAPMQIGTPVRNNLTPMEAALGCYARSLAASGRAPLVIGVGEIKDFTGISSPFESPSKGIMLKNNTEEDLNFNVKFLTELIVKNNK